MNQETKIRNELIELSNIQKFVGKYIAVMGDAALSAISDGEAGETVANQLKDLVKGYPNQLRGVAEDITFYLDLLKRLHLALILIGLEEVNADKKQNQKKAIEQSLNDMLGFRN